MTSRTSGTSGTSGTYVYCVVAARRPPSIARALTGPPGTRRARLLEVRPNRYLVVSDAPLDAFGEAPLANRLSDLEWVSRAAMAHNAVIGKFIDADAVLPMKVFTIFKSDERALEQTRSDWKRIETLLRTLTGRVEWGLRLVYDERKVPSAKTTKRPSTGTNYLLAKRQQQSTTVARTRLVRKRTTDLVEVLTRLAHDMKERPLEAGSTGSRLLLDAAFLVPRTRATRFRAAVARQARRLAPEGYAVHLSGPWPPYSFVASS